MWLAATLYIFLLKPELYHTARKMRIQVPAGSRSEWLTADWRAAWVREQSSKEANAMGGESILSGHRVCGGLIKAVERMTGIRLRCHTNSNGRTCAASTKNDKIDFSYCFKGGEKNLLCHVGDKEQKSKANDSFHETLCLFWSFFKINLPFCCEFINNTLSSDCTCLIAYRAGNWDAITSGCSSHMWRRMLTPGVRWHT